MNGCSGIDWTATGTMMSGMGALLGAIATAMGAVAVVWAAKVASNTFDNWKRQKIAERKFDQAERILTATYQGRDAISYIRTAMIWPQELDAAKKRLEQEPEWAMVPNAKKERLLTTQAILNRVSNSGDQQNALVACLPMASALFGQEIEEAISKLARQFRLAGINADAYGQDEGGDEQFTASIRALIWPHGDQPTDDVSVAVRESIATIEATCLPILRS